MLDFEEKINQRGTCDEKHDRMVCYFGRDDLIPMWVAETDFSTAEEIKEALLKRVEHGIFGYSYQSESFYDSIIQWYKTQHHLDLKSENIFFDTGVLKALYEMIQIFTNEGDGILIHTPVYPQFEKVITHTKRKVVTNKLRVIDHRFEIDFESLEEAMKEVKLFILCSPHNPAGMVWNQDDLVRVITLCEKYDVVLVSDEIHSDLSMADQTFISALALSDKAIILNSPSKTFNLAGLQINMTITKDAHQVQLIGEHLAKHKIKSSNTLSMVALEAAYTSGQAYRERVVTKIKDNYDLIKSLVIESKKKIEVYDLEASYLVWLDFSAYFTSYEALYDFFIQECKVAVTFGKDFGEGCDLFVRLNIATQRSTCLEVMNRILSNLKESMND